MVPLASDAQAGATHCCCAAFAASRLPDKRERLFGWRSAAFDRFPLPAAILACGMLSADFPAKRRWRERRLSICYTPPAAMLSDDRSCARHTHMQALWPSDAAGAALLASDSTSNQPDRCAEQRHSAPPIRTSESRAAKQPIAMSECTGLTPLVLLYSRHRSRHSTVHCHMLDVPFTVLRTLIMRIRGFASSSLFSRRVCFHLSSTLFFSSSTETIFMCLIFFRRRLLVILSPHHLPGPTCAAVSTRRPST